MLKVPQENYCRICQKLFCCAECRSKHEEKTHPEELEMLKQEELLQMQCHICNGLPLPINYKESLTIEMIRHVAKIHLPLQCNKCFKQFEKIDDFSMIGKCCNEEEQRQQAIEMTKENMGDSINVPEIKIDDASTKKDEMTPMAQMHARFQRKNREFGKIIDEEAVKPPGSLSKKTSTPLATNIDSPLAMHISSINFTSSASETDLSPPASAVMPAPKQPLPTPAATSPKTKKPPSTSRNRLPVHNTPLRQLMTKSIQRAIAQHGHYKNLGIQQRRMTFDSTSSSYEQTVSLMKLQLESFENQSNSNRNETSHQPLDLRMSPALRRDQKPPQVAPKSQTPILQIEAVNIVLRRCESDSSIVTNYQSCISEGIATPKVSIPTAFKKTISFETPAMIDNTPAMLIPKISRRNSDESGDEVFYTPEATPVRRFSMESGIRAVELNRKLEEILEEKNTKEKIEHKSPKRNKFWGWVETAANYAKRSSGGSTGSEPSEKKLSNLGMVLRRRAAGLFGMTSKPTSESDDSALKRRRESSSTSSEKFEEIDDKHTSSPKMKKRRIQGRKPIERMRNISLN